MKKARTIPIFLFAGRHANPGRNSGMIFSLSDERGRNYSAVLAFLGMSAESTFAQANDKEVEAVRAADAAWMKVYHAKDLDKSLSFLDEQGSMLFSNTPIE